MKSIQSIVKSIAKNNNHKTFTERYHVYYKNGDCLTLDTHQLTETMCKFIATHKATAGDTITNKETGLVYKEVIFK